MVAPVRVLGFFNIYIFYIHELCFLVFFLQKIECCEFCSRLFLLQGSVSIPEISYVYGPYNQLVLRGLRDSSYAESQLGGIPIIYFLTPLIYNFF